MLIKFAVKNFRGFAERIEWDLSHRMGLITSQQLLFQHIRC